MTNQQDTVIIGADGLTCEQREYREHLAAKKSKPPRPKIEDVPVEEDTTLAAMRADTKRALIELRHAIVNSLLLHIANGEMSDSDLITLYKIVK